MDSSRIWRRRALTAACLTLVLALPYSTASGAVEEPPLVFAAGRGQGNYFALASAVAEEMAGRDRRVQVRETQGSYDNAALLRNGEADLALLQSDVAYLEHYNRRPFLALASVYTEPIHILAYRGLDLRRISDLIPGDDHFVAAVGAPGSGSSPHALAVLDEIGLEPGRISTVHQSLDEAATGLRNRTVDLAFVTTAVPSKAVLELSRDEIVSLLDVDRDIAQRLRRRNPFFVAAEIPWEAYGVGGRNVQTLGTETLLVTRPDLPAEDVAQVLDALYAVADRSDERALTFLDDLSPSRALHQLAIPAHPASTEYHQALIGPYGAWLELLRKNAILLVLFGAGLLALFRLPRLAYFVHQFVLGRVLLALAAIWVIGSVAMYLFEGSKSRAFSTFGKSAIAILYYLFSGLEASYPLTPQGNAVAILVLSLGVGVVTLFTATLVQLLVEHALNIKTLRHKPVPFLRLSGHTVIAGWSGRTKRIIRQLRSSDLRTKPTVVVIAPKASDTKVEDRSSFRGVWVVEGDESKADTLHKADLERASCAVVLPADSRESASGDLSSICCTQAIEHLAPAVHTIVESRISSAVDHLKRIRADEIVDTESLAKRLLSQCVVTPGIAAVFDELLSFGIDSQEIYLLPVDRQLGGRSFHEIRERLRPFTAILLGLWPAGERNPRLNPVAIDAARPLVAGGRDGDKLIVLADSPREIASWRARARLWRTKMNDKTPTTETEGVPSSAENGSEPEVEVRGEPRATRIGICGWNDEARAVIQQLQESVIASHREFEFTVIDGPLSEGVEKGCTRNVHFVFGDPTRRAVLDNAGVAEMETLVVLAARSGKKEKRFSDHRSLVICLAAREVKPKLHLVVEVLQSESQEHFQRIENVEIVSVDDLAEKLLAQAVVSPGISRVYTELLTATEDSNEIYIVPVPSRWEGKPFSQIAGHVEENRRPAIALGYRTRAEAGHPVVVLNPHPRERRRNGVVDWRQRPLGREDALVVMAYEEPAW